MTLERCVEHLRVLGNDDNSCCDLDSITAHMLRHPVPIPALERVRRSGQRRELRVAR